MKSSRKLFTYLLAGSLLLATKVAYGQGGPLGATVTITGHLAKESPTDTLRLYVHGQYALNRSQLSVKDTLTCITTDGAFAFGLKEMDAPTYISLWASSKGEVSFGRLIPSPVFEQYLVRPGDSIHIESNLKYTLFSGRGAERLNVWEDIQRLSALKRMAQPKTTFVTNAGIYIQMLQNMDSIYHYQQKVLEYHKTSLEPEDYKHFKADLIAINREQLYRGFSWEDFMTWSEDFGDTVLNYYGSNYYNTAVDTSSVGLTPLSPYYTTYLYFKTMADARYEALAPDGQPSQAEGTVKRLSARFEGELLDKILTTHMYIKLAGSTLDDELLDALAEKVRTPRYAAMIGAIRQQFGKGEPVTGFAFEDRDGNRVTLADFEGQVVFVDMWFTGCTGCITVAKALPEVEAYFHGRGVKFVSLSVDRDRRQWLKSIDPKGTQTKGYAYTHYTTATTAYTYTGGSGWNHPFIKRYVPANAYPKLMVIDGKGRIFSNAPPRPDAKGGKEALISLIEKALEME